MLPQLARIADLRGVAGQPGVTIKPAQPQPAWREAAPQPKADQVSPGLVETDAAGL
jgi:hypothetical protein